VTEVGLLKSALDTPALWVDLDTLESNIGKLAHQFNQAGVHWRPHTKSLKIPSLAHMAIDAGAIGVTCAKLSEAEVMAAAGIRDILIANQIVGAQKITRLVNLRCRADVKVAVDNVDNVAELAAAALAKGVKLGVVIEIDVGLKRAGVQSSTEAFALAQVIHRTNGLRFMGFMAWEGHATLIQQAVAKEAEIRASIDQLLEAVTLCHEAGIPVEIVSAGGSATVDYTAFIAGITEVQAGGAIFSDVLYQQRGVTNAPALFVRSTVTSRPTPERIIFDCGFKSLPAWNAAPQLIGVEGVKSVRMSAEHGTVTLEQPNTTIRVGDAFDFVVGYGDFTVFLHDHLYGIRDGVVEVVWDIVGRGKVR
jgi:D-serine deaminase-like pyridoxal phosphate-dependent protein